LSRWPGRAFLKFLAADSLPFLDPNARPTPSKSKALRVRPGARMQSHTPPPTRQWACFWEQFRSVKRYGRFLCRPRVTQPRATHGTGVRTILKPGTTMENSSSFLVSRFRLEMCASVPFWHVPLRVQGMRMLSIRPLARDRLRRTTRLRRRTDGYQTREQLASENYNSFSETTEVVYNTLPADEFS
jgi:hypothetical protein